jgi:Domain of unknown function (DUF5668)
MSTSPNIIGYCRACGKALDESTAHPAHGTIYCAEHLPVDPAAAEAPQGLVRPQAPDASPYTAATPPPVPRPDVSPGIAFFLGFIPGVGAIYNGQYAKGLIHVIIVGLIISVLDRGAGNLEPLLSLLLAGFWFYMAFEAYHTAKKRQLGQPVDEFSSIIPMHGPARHRFPAAPVVLIALGVIFLLDNLDLLDMERLLRYWPVALIALGAYMLYLRMGGGTHDERGGR